MMNGAFPQTNGSTPPQTNGSTPSQTNGATSPQTWLKCSVQQFFNAINWDDHPPEIQRLRLATTQDGPQLLSLALPVSQFFSAIQWDGDAASSPQPLPPAPSDADTLTLDDFSDLF